MNSIAAGVAMARRRKELKQTQADLAARLGISQRMVAACETGERRPSVKLAMRIEQELGIMWTVFFQPDEEKSDNVDGFEGEEG